MIIFTDMIFKPTLLVKISALILCSIGILLFVLFLTSILQAMEADQVKMLPALILIPGLFMVIGLFGFRSMKIIEQTKNEWIFKYAYRNKIVRLNSDNVWIINIQKRAKLGNLLFGDQIFIKTKHGKRLSFSSNELTDYAFLEEGLITDFPKHVKIMPSTFSL